MAFALAAARAVGTVMMEVDTAAVAPFVPLDPSWGWGLGAGAVTAVSVGTRL